MPLPDTTPLRIHDADRFKGEIDAITTLIDALRPALYESPPHPHLVERASPSVDQQSPKAQLTHQVRHVLSGLHTLHEQPMLGTARAILAKREDTFQAIRQVTHEFGADTLPRDQLQQLDLKLIDMFHRVERLATTAKGPHATAIEAEDRKGPRSIG